jgi:hypothetical protein
MGTAESRFSSSKIRLGEIDRKQGGKWEFSEGGELEMDNNQ